MKEFSELTLQKLNKTGEYYVYGLVDPRNNNLFYVGKGTGNRVFQHVIESGNNPESEKLKLQTIKNIENSGNKVQHILINWGLTESEAFASEASLINLTNYLSEDIKHKLLVIKVNKLYNRHMSATETYDIVRGIWNASIIRASQADYVLGVYNSLIIACYKPNRWYKVSECTVDKLPKHTQDSDLSNMQNRIFFECDNIETLDENQLFYLNKSIENMKHIQKSQNPISYIGF